MVPKPLSGPPGRVRVMRIITRLNVGGPAIQAMLLATRLDPQRFETLLVAGTPGRHEGDMSELRPVPGVRPTIVASLGREISPLGDLRSLIDLTRLMRSYRPHIVHTHLAKAGLLGRVAAGIVRVPVTVHTFHGTVFRGYFDPVRSRTFLALERALARRTTRILAISQRQAEEIRALGIASGKRLLRVPLGLDLSAFAQPRRGQLRAELGIDAGVPLIGAVTRLVPIKGIDVFLDAAAAVARERPAARFVIAGDGELGGILRERAARLGLGDRVRFLGWRADVASLYADIDVVVLTSHSEGTPVSVIEALAARRAVVATAVGGVPDIVSAETGVLVADGDGAGVARAIVALIDDPEQRRRLGESGRAHVLPAYDAITLVRRIEELYDELAEGLAR